MVNRNVFICIALLGVLKLSAQENSPYSRYGIGDLYPNQSIASRAMGGLTSAFADAQAINSNNPATYGNIKLVTYDVAFSMNFQTLIDNSSGLKYNAANLEPSYFQLAIPISQKKKIGFVFGLKSISRINYNVQGISKILVNSETNTYDSLTTLYTGNGGLNQGFIGFGKRWNNLNIGFNTGWNFGQKVINTNVSFLNDTVLYYQSASGGNTAFWGLFLNLGAQYELKIGGHTDNITKVKSSYFLRLGADIDFQRTLKANETLTRQTIYYDANGAPVKIDSVYQQNNILGTVFIPLTYNAGAMLVKRVNISGLEYDKWMIGAEYDAGNWNQFTYYGESDKLTNNWTLRAGGQITPNVLDDKSFWNRATYRLGFSTGKDYINADNNSLKNYGISIGAGFNIRRFRTAYSNQFSLINTAFEFTKRGTSINSVSENYFKFSVGFSLSDIWFIKRRYD